MLKSIGYVAKDIKTSQSMDGKKPEDANAFTLSSNNQEAMDQIID